MNNADQTILTAAQLSEIKSVLNKKTITTMQAGNLQAFSFVETQAKLAKILAFKKIKESGEYKGIPYVDINGEEQFTQNIKEFCTFILDESLSLLYEELQNIDTLGQVFFEKTNHLKLGRKELRLLRKTPENERNDIIEKINNEEINLNDKDAVKEFIEDEAFKHATQTHELKKRVDEAEQTVAAVRENSAEKQQQLDMLKEIEAKRTFKQAPWEREASDSVNAMLTARASIMQGNNQLIEVLNNLTGNPELDDKAVEHIARSLLSEVQHNLTVLSQLTSDVFAILGGKFSPDLSVNELFTMLNLEPPESILLDD